MMRLGTETGSLVNHLVSRCASQTPEVDMGATIICWSDRRPATISYVSPSGKTIRVREDRAIRTDSNGMSEQQDYRFEPRPDAHEQTFRFGKKGWRESGGGNALLVGQRDAYHDFSF